MGRESKRDLRLAVSTPGGVEFQENVLLVVNDKFLVAVTHNHGNITLLAFGNGLGLDAGLNFAINHVLDELSNLLGVNLLGLVVWVLSILGGLLDRKSGEGLGLQVEVSSVGTEQLGVEGDNVDLPAVLSSDRTEVLGELLALFGGLREDVGQGKSSLREERKISYLGPFARVTGIISYRHVLGVGLGAKFTDKGSASGLDPCEDRLLIKLAVVDILLLVEILVKDNGGLLSPLGLGESDIVGGSEEVVVPLGFGEGSEALVGGLVVGADIADNHDVVQSLEFLQVLLSHAGNGGHGLLGHVGHNPIGKTTSQPTSHRYFGIPEVLVYTYESA